MKSIRHPIAAYRRAHQLLWKMQFWRILIWPVLISIALTVLLFVGYLAVGNWLFSEVEAFFFGEEQLPAWLRAIFWLLLVVQFSGPLYVAFRGLVLICYGPFLDTLSTKIERAEHGKVMETERTLWESIQRPLLMFVWTFSASMGVLLASVALGLVPLIGVLLGVVIQFPIQMFLSGVSYIDPYMDRAGYTPRESFRVIRQHFAGSAIFAMLGLLIQAIPVVGWFVGPTYSVIAGVLYGIRIDSDSAAAPAPAPETPVEK